MLQKRVIKMPNNRRPPGWLKGDHDYEGTTSNGEYSEIDIKNEKLCRELNVDYGMITKFIARYKENSKRKI